MTVSSSLRPFAARVKRVLRSMAGAFDLPSIIVGVVVVGILAAGVLAAVFAVIPFAQDNGAKQDLGAVRTAEGVAKAKDGRYMDKAGLDMAGYLKTESDLAVGTDSIGSCWVGFAKSGSGATFYATAAKMDPALYTAGTDTGCITVAEQEALVASVGATPAAAPAVAPTATTAGYASAWGANSSGQLGDGTIAQSSTPVATSTTAALSGKSVASVSSGYNFTCAAADGAAYCWGSNGSGNLGNGTIVASNVPVAVDATGVLAGKTITSVSAGVYHACAVADGAVYCWGSNQYGQLGNASTVGSFSTPVAVATNGVLSGKTVTSITAGFGHTCAIADGAAYCWGNNNAGQLGNGSATSSSAPVAVSTTGPLAGKTVTSIAVGNGFTCATAGGTANCWGVGSSGQLGTSTTADSRVPVAVTTSGALAGKLVASVSTGEDFACAIADGALYCWGGNTYGQLGSGTTGGFSTSPVVVNTSGVLSGRAVTSASLSAISTHACVVADAAAYCWGMGGSGQLGNGSTANSDIPVAVGTAGLLGGKTVMSVASGSDHTAIVYK